jgi:hypothetical protein
MPLHGTGFRMRPASRATHAATLSRQDSMSLIESRSSGTGSKPPVLVARSTSNLESSEIASCTTISSVPGFAPLRTSTRETGAGVGVLDGPGASEGGRALEPFADPGAADAVGGFVADGSHAIAQSIRDNASTLRRMHDVRTTTANIPQPSRSLDSFCSIRAPALRAFSARGQATWPAARSSSRSSNRSKKVRLHERW